MLILSGCAVQYRDSQTGTEHLWGFGHLAMRATIPEEGRKAVVQSVSVCGFGLGLRDQLPFVTLGWEQQQQLIVVDSDTSVRLEGPNADLLNIRVGSKPPQQSPKEVQ